MPLTAGKLELGTTNVETLGKVYFGTSQVNRMFVGETIVFPSAVFSLLNIKYTNVSQATLCAGTGTTVSLYWVDGESLNVGDYVWTDGGRTTLAAAGWYGAGGNSSTFYYVNPAGVVSSIGQCPTPTPTPTLTPTPTPTPTRTSTPTPTPLPTYTYRIYTIYSVDSFCNLSPIDTGFSKNEAAATGYYFINSYNSGTRYYIVLQQTYTDTTDPGYSYLSGFVGTSCTPPTATPTPTPVPPTATPTPTPVPPTATPTPTPPPPTATPTPTPPPPTSTPTPTPPPTCYTYTNYDYSPDVFVSYRSCAGFDTTTTLGLFESICAQTVYFPGGLAQGGTC